MAGPNGAAGWTRERLAWVAGVVMALSGALGLARSGPARAQAQGTATAGPDRIELRIAAPSSIEAGATAQLSVTLVPGRGFGLPPAGRWGLTVTSTPAAVVVIERGKFQRRDAADPDADAPRIAFKAQGGEPGRADLRFKFHGWVCSVRLCYPVETSVTAGITVTAPAPVPPPVADAGVRD